MIVTDPRRQRTIVLSVAFAAFMVNLDSYIVNISLPTIAGDFHAPADHVEWVMLSYFIMVASTLLIFGRLGDRLGLKRVFLVGFAVFTASSLLCGLAPNLPLLVLGRFLQGLGAAMLNALTPAMVPRFLPPAERGSAFGKLATASALGITVGTPLGGLLTGWLSWHWIFLVNVPVGIVAVLVGLRALPDDAQESGGASHREDLPGAVLSLLASIALMGAISEVGQHGWSTLTIVGCFVAALIFGAAFLRREATTPYPLLDLSLFRDRAFSFGNVAAALAFAFLAGQNFLVPFYLTHVQGLSPQDAGFAFLTYSVVYMAVGPLCGRLMRVVSPRILCTVTAGGGALVAVLFASTLHVTGLMWVLIYFVLLAICFAIFCTANNSVVMESAPEGRQGIVAATFRMCIRFGMTVGVSIFTAVFSAVDPADSNFTGASLTVNRAIRVEGFRAAYLVGAAVCVLAMVASMQARSAAVAEGKVEEE